MDIVLAKLVICILCTSLILVTVSQQNRLAALTSSLHLNTWIGSLWVVFRLLPFLLVFIVLKIEPTSDVNGFWYMATHAVEGKLVYRDFWSPYSPFYSYLLAVGAFVWNNPRVVVLIMIIMEGITVLLSCHFFKSVQTKERLFFKSLLYFLMPGSLILCVLGAQEDIWIWLFFAISVLVKRKTKSVIAYSLILALGILTTKAIFVLFLLPLFLLEKDKWRFTWPLTAVGAISLISLYLSVGMEFLQPIGEADTLRAPNIVSVINPWTYSSIGMGEGFWNWIGLFITLALGCYGAYKWRNDDFIFSATRIFVIMYATLMIVQQSAYSNYIFLFLLPFVFVLSDFNNRKFVSFLLFYNILCTVHPSFWWRSGMPKYHSPGDIFSSVDAVTDYSLQFAIVGLTIYLILYTLKLTETSIKRIL